MGFASFISGVLRILSSLDVLGTRDEIRSEFCRIFAGRVDPEFAEWFPRQIHFFLRVGYRIHIRGSFGLSV
jgi:hypothetical protein